MFNEKTPEEKKLFAKLEARGRQRHAFTVEVQGDPVWVPAAAVTPLVIVASLLPHLNDALVPEMLALLGNVALTADQTEWSDPKTKSNLVPVNADDLTALAFYAARDGAWFGPDIAGDVADALEALTPYAEAWQKDFEATLIANGQATREELDASHVVVGTIIEELLA